MTGNQREELVYIMHRILCKIFFGRLQDEGTTLQHRLIRHLRACRRKSNIIILLCSSAHNRLYLELTAALHHRQEISTINLRFLHYSSDHVQLMSNQFLVLQFQSYVSHHFTHRSCHQIIEVFVSKIWNLGLVNMFYNSLESVRS